MGMYSWLCKGCKEELNMGEYVKLGGRRQVYDGYGGSAGRGDDYDPAAWHCRCYDKASTEEKLSEEGSESAPNQGMGYARLEFKEGYDENAFTTYDAVIFGSRYDPEAGTSTEWEFYLTDNGLEDQVAYQKRLETTYEEMNKTKPKEWFDQLISLPRVQADKIAEDHAKEAVQKVGISPRNRSQKFASVEECRASMEAQFVNIRPASSGGPTYKDFVIFGTQGEVSGMVYRQHLEKDPSFLEE